jgi:hypothetical protein
MAIVYWEDKGEQLEPLEVDENFRELETKSDQLREDVDLKLLASEKGAAGGVASLNNLLKVIETCLNSEKLDGKTFAQISELFIATAARGINNGVAELDSAGKLRAAQIPDSVASGLVYKGGWNANTNTPAIPAAGVGNKGWFYIVTTAGTTTISGISVWAVGDWIISNGASWEKVPSSQLVLSVAGKTGALTLDIADITGLTTALGNKQNVGAEAKILAISDFDDAETPGEWLIESLAGIDNAPAAVGELLTGPGMIHIMKRDTLIVFDL